MIEFIKKTLVFLFAISILCFFAVFLILWIFSTDLPDYKFLKNYKPPVSSRVYAGNGELIAEFSTEKRIFVPFESIPEKVLYSFLSAEDKNFFNHPGIDAKGIVRAIVKNINNILNSKRL